MNSVLTNTDIVNSNDEHTLMMTDKQAPCCIASTGSVYSGTVGTTLQQETNSNSSTSNIYRAPDGSCLLTINNDNIVRLFDFPTQLLDDIPEMTLTPSLSVSSGDTLYDAVWYPFMSSQDPASCCFITSTKDHPIHLWDAFTGQLRASYTVIDHQERFIGPTALTFNLDGTRIYAGYENMIEVFHIDRPGNESSKYATTPSRRSRQGQKGLISSLAFNPDRSGVYAAGSFTGSIGIYSEQNQQLIYQLTGADVGVIQVKFTPDGNYLYSASRKSNSILAWDIRQTGTILHRLEREYTTNQRMTFDIDRHGNQLITGDQYGGVSLFDIQIKNESLEDGSTMPARTHWSQLHQDICSAVEFHPIYSDTLWASCSGQRKFPLDLDEETPSSATTLDDETSIDNRLALWKYGTSISSE
ncbi:WD40-repeat-containing domain protein [Syncephalis plumigaleata]|nr:WD40-repeat-containing domain protein [Syncephalis plumigaleata]